MLTTGFKLATAEEFFHAIETGDIKTVDALYFTDYHLSAKNSANLTALHLAIMQSNENLTQWLLAQGANPDVTDDLDYTPLHLASVMGQERLVKLLLNSQATISKNAKDGKTPLQLATDLSHIQIVNLLEKNANFLSDNRMANQPSEKIINHQQQAITHTHTTRDISLTYIPVNSDYAMLILEQQLAEKDNLISAQQETLYQQQHEIHKLNREFENKNQEIAHLRAQLSFYCQSMHSNNAQFMTPLIEPIIISESTEEKTSNTNQVINNNL